MVRKERIEKLSEQHVCDIVNWTSSCLSPIVDSALTNIREHIASNLDYFAQQENDETRQILEATNELDQDPEESAEDVLPQEMNMSVPQNTLLFMSEKDLNEKKRSLNIQQRS